MFIPKWQKQVKQRKVDQMRNEFVCYLLRIRSFVKQADEYKWHKTTKEKRREGVEEDTGLLVAKIPRFEHCSAKFT